MPQRAAQRSLAQLARRAGRSEEAAQDEARRRILLDAAIRTLSGDDLRRDLLAAAR